MIKKFFSQSIKRNLYIFTIVMFAAFFSIAMPLLWNSYKNYIEYQQAVKDLQVFIKVSDIGVQISKERAFANKAMATTDETLIVQKNNLRIYRNELDHNIASTIAFLEENHYTKFAIMLKQQVVPSLQTSRKKVDQYIQLAQSERRIQDMDQAINAMFAAWDSNRFLQQEFFKQSQAQNEILFKQFRKILLLSNLREQAGRVGSSIIAPIVFQQPISIQHQQRSLYAQQQAVYLWSFIDLLYSDKDRTAEYQQLQQNVKNKFFDEGLTFVNELIHDSNQHQSYMVNALEFTQILQYKFQAVVDLQDYISVHSVEIAEGYRDHQKYKFFSGLFLIILILFLVTFILFHIQRAVLLPLIDAKQRILKLAKVQQDEYDKETDLPQAEIPALFSAIKQLEYMIKQRELLESQLRDRIYTDTLTGVANRSALENYLNLLNEQPERFQNFGLIVLDIDYFKHINDNYGHVVGDNVIKKVADGLKESLRHSDLMIRYGGDEFLILLEYSNIEKTKFIAEKVRQKIAEQAIYIDSIDETLQLSISVGWAQGGESWVDLLVRADDALLMAKALGRNRVYSEQAN